MLLSEGDILLLYAVVGLLLLPLRGARPEILRRWVKWLLIVPAAVAVLMFGALALGRASPEGAAEMAATDREMEEEFRTEARDVTAAYLEPAFVRTAATRVGIYARNAWLPLVLAPTVLAMFLLGLAAGRRGLTPHAADHRALLRRLRTWGLVIGLPVAALSATGAALLPTLSALMCLWVNGTIAGPLLAMAYGSGIALLWQRPGWQRILRPLAAMGRMALTKLPPAVGRRHPAVLRVRPRSGAARISVAGAPDRRRHPGRTAPDQRLVAAPLPLRPRRVAVADTDLRLPPAAPPGRGLSFD